MKFLDNVSQGTRNSRNASKAANLEQPHPSPAIILSSQAPPGVISPQMAMLQMPYAPTSTLSTSLIPILGTPGTNSNRNCVTNLVKPSVFFALSSSSSSSAQLMPPMSSSTASIHQSPLHLLHGAPFLQPFPPPSLPLSLAPALTPTPISDSGLVISRDKVRDAVMKLAQVCRF